MKNKIHGTESLTQEQQDHLIRSNKQHTRCVGTEYKSGMAITEAWVDESGTVCARLKNGQWFHYYKDGSWG